MKAIYEITFRVTTNPDVVSDVRRKCFPASNLGILNAARWAVSVAEKLEFVSDIKLLAVEKP